MPILDRFRLDGKRALVTGGSRGLGRAIAVALAEAGADLVLVARDADALRAASRDLAPLGRRIDTHAADLGTPAEAERACNHILGTFAPIHVLVNNVGGRLLNTPAEDLPLADWQRVLDLNLTSTFLLCRSIGGEMVKRRSGKIINIASIAGPVVIRGLLGRSYEAAKAAVIALTKSLAADWAPSNVQVNAIAPGGFLTDPNRRRFADSPEFRRSFESMIPMGRIGEPDEIGPLAVYLASDASSYMTGVTLPLDGGYTLW